MERGSRVPADVKVVVHSSRPGAVREQLPSIAVFALTAAAAGFGVSATGTAFGVWLVIGLLCVLGVVVELLILRSDIALGPALAADADHVWVRVGGFLRPASVRLDWPEITGIGLHTWRGRRKATARYLTVRVTDEARVVLDRELAGVLDRRLRRLATTFGSPLAVSDQHKSPGLDEVVRRLRDLAPDGSGSPTASGGPELSVPATSLRSMGFHRWRQKAIGHRRALAEPLIGCGPVGGL